VLAKVSGFSFGAGRLYLIPDPLAALQKARIDQGADRRGDVLAALQNPQRGPIHLISVAAWNARIGHIVEPGRIDDAVRVERQQLLLG
jgi:hypothetical protein